jgi:hypothetical protein
VTAGLDIEAGPPFLGPLIGLAGAALFLVVIGILGLPDSPVFLVVWIALLGGSLLAGGYVVRRALAKRWTDAIGTPPPMSMLLGVVDDRLVIWQWPRRGNPPPGRLLDVPLTEVALRPRAALLGGLEIELPSGKTLLVNHSTGPHERQSLALILAAVADAHGQPDDMAQPQG